MVGDNIKYYREKNSLSLTDLANLINVEESIIAKWEDNLESPDILAIKSLAKALNVSTDDLLNDKIKQDIKNEKEYPYLTYTHKKNILIFFCLDFAFGILINILSFVFMGRFSTLIVLNIVANACMFIFFLYLYEKPEAIKYLKIYFFALIGLTIILSAKSFFSSFSISDITLTINMALWVLYLLILYKKLNDYIALSICVLVNLIATMVSATITTVILLAGSSDAISMVFMNFIFAVSVAKALFEYFFNKYLMKDLIIKDNNKSID